ncbi:hypothetical protein EJB05_12569, partial [Eragrostis curvula]
MNDKGKKLVGSSIQAQKPVPLEAKVRLQAPNEGWIKISVDRAFTDSDAGIGLIIRDQNGKQLFSSQWVLCMKSAEEVEAYACRECLALVADCTPRPAVLESDCSMVINYLLELQKKRQKALVFAQQFPSVEFRHTRRDQNGVPHELAQLAKRLCHSAVQRDRVQAYVEHLVTHDFNPTLSV